METIGECACEGVSWNTRCQLGLLFCSSGDRGPMEVEPDPLMCTDCCDDHGGQCVSPWNEVTMNCQRWESKVGPCQRNGETSRQVAQGFRCLETTAGGETSVE